MIALHDQTYVLSFAEPCAAGAFKIGDAGGKAGFLKKKFYVSGLAVADDEKGVFFRKPADGIGYAGEEQILVTGRQGCVFPQAAVINEGIAFLLRQGRKGQVCNSRQGAPKKLLEILGSKLKGNVRVSPDGFVPCGRNDGSGVPEGAVYVEDNAVWFHMKDSFLLRCCSV